MAEYVTPAQQHSFTQQCDQDEQWLYEDGEHASLEAYEDRVKALRMIGDPAANRHKVRDDVGFALNGFVNKMNGLRQSALSAIGKASHIPEEELTKAAMSVDEAIAWAQKEVHTLMTAPKHQEGNFTTRNLDEKLRSITKSVNAVINRPPPKKETKPASSPTTATTNTGTSPTTSGEANTKGNKGEAQPNCSNTTVEKDEEEEEAAAAAGNATNKQQNC